MHLRPACLLLSLLITTSSLSGIEIFLKNGDRLQGDLVVESDDHITLCHPILDEIEVAKKDLAEWPMLEKPSVPTIASSGTKAKKPYTKPKAEGTKKVSQPEVAKSKEPKVLEPQDQEESSGIKPIVKKIPVYVWNTPKELVETLKRMNSMVGFSFTDRASRRDQTDFRFFYNSRWKNGKSEYRLDSDYRYSETDGDTSADRYSGIFRFRRQQQRDLFIQASSSYRRDPLRKINHMFEQGLGGGWKKKVSPTFEYSVGGEAAVKFEDFNNGSSDLGGFEFLTSVFQDSVYDIGKSYSLVQEAEAYIAPDDNENRGYRFEVKLDGKISNGFTVRLGYEYSFDNIVARNVPQKETLLSSSMIYTF